MIYINKGYDENILNSATVAARNPGTWANGLKVAIIDSQADQILGINTTGVSIFSASVPNRSGVLIGSASTIGITTTSISIGQEIRCDVDGVLPTGTTVQGIGVGVITMSQSSLLSVDITTSFDFGATTVSGTPPAVGAGITQAVPAGTVKAGAGTTEVLDGMFKGIITEIGTGTIGVKFISHVTGGVETAVDYEPSGVYKFSNTSVAIHTAGQSVAYGTTAITSTADWFDSQTITTTNGKPISWNQVADRPGTSAYAAARNSRFDEVHVVVIDDDGDVTGNAGTILEKNLNLSKAKDAEFAAGSTSYWRKFLLNSSNNIFGLSGPSGSVNTGFGSGSGGF